MPKFEVFEGDLSVMMITAQDENQAWIKLKKAGIRNQSKLMSLVRLD